INISKTFRYRFSRANPLHARTHSQALPKPWDLISSLRLCLSQSKKHIPWSNYEFCPCVSYFPVCLGFFFVRKFPSRNALLIAIFLGSQRLFLQTTIFFSYVKAYCLTFSSV
ncbi:MAG: hypothetical protein ACI4BI_02045, partial [Anaerotardibacter sp.]